MRGPRPPPPSDDDTTTPPPSDDDTTTPPPSDDDTDTPGPDDEDDDEPFLPFTGGELFTLLASGFVAAGLGLNLRERSTESPEVDEDE